MFTVIKKETAWREVGLEGRGVGERKGRRLGEGVRHRRHICPCGVGGSLPTLTQGLF